MIVWLYCTKGFSGFTNANGNAIGYHSFSSCFLTSHYYMMTFFILLLLLECNLPPGQFKTPGSQFFEIQLTLDSLTTHPNVAQFVLFYKLAFSSVLESILLKKNFWAKLPDPSFFTYPCTSTRLLESSVASTSALVFITCSINIGHVVCKN